MPSLHHKGIEIHYSDEGEGPVTLLFVHGLYADSSYWQAQIEEFKARYRCVAVDLPGHGQSAGREHYSIRTYAEDLVALLKELGQQRVVVIAHSLGADVALVALAGRPGSVLGFVAIDAFKSAGEELTEQHKPIVEELLEQLKEDVASAQERYARMVLVSDQTPAEVAERVVKAYRTAEPNLARQMLPDAFAASELERTLLPKLDKKLYLINVSNHPTQQEPLGRLLNAGYELTEIPGTSHYPMLESPEGLNQQLDRIIERMGEPEASPLGTL